MEETLGTRIAAHRKRLGLTQDQLAEKLGITAQAVSKWEHDQSCPDITILPRLAAIFGTTTDALLGVEPAPVRQAELVTAEEEDDDDNGSWEFHWDGGRKSRLSLAALVLLVGGLLLAGNILKWDVGFWGVLWPSTLLVFGVTGLWPRFRFFRLACTLCGGWFLADAIGVLPAPLDSGIIFPAMLVLLGLSLLAEALRRPCKPFFHVHHGGSHRKGANACNMGEESFMIENCFSENEHLIELPRLSYGAVECAFGEVILDLSGCREVSPDCRIAIEGAFSSVELLVPRRFRAEPMASTFFAGVDTEGAPDPGAPVIHVDCEIAFGSLDIRYI